MNPVLVLKAPAKINWFLAIQGKRDDGYHEIISLMQTVTLYDELTFETSDEIEVISETDIPLEENLVYRAANLLKTMSEGSGVRITLRKEIPIAAGLGGGSSDAATTIMGLNRLWRLGLTISEMMRLGATIGSDVPFFFNGPAAIVRGRGESVSPIRPEHSYPLLLVKPPLKINTKWAYSEFDRGTIRSSIPLSLIEHFDLSFERNDLEEVVIKRYQEVGDIKSILKKEGAIFTIMSGSGPTVIGVFSSYETAEQARRVIPEHYWCRLVRTIV